MTFDEWISKACFKTPTDEAYALAKEAWEASEAETVHGVLKVLAGNNWSDSPFGTLLRATCNRLVDRINVALSETGWYFMVCDDGMAVGRRAYLSDKLAKNVFEAM